MTKYRLSMTKKHPVFFCQIHSVHLIDNKAGGFYESVTDNLMKIEVWSRSSSIDKFLFGYDLFLFNPEDDSIDFEWGDSSRGAFTITTYDPENDYHWEREKFVAFTLSNPDYSYSTVSEYINQ